MSQIPVPIEATIKRKDDRKKKEPKPEGILQIYLGWDWGQDGDGWQDGDSPIIGQDDRENEDLDCRLKVNKNETCPIIEGEHMERRTPDYSVLFCCPDIPLSPVESKEAKKKKKQLENLDEIQNRD